MLFQKLYNWIKYKTLPPSTIFRGRLLFERDAKYRRIVANIGLTYRNLKWTFYSRPNLMRSSLNFLKTLVVLLLLILIIPFVLTITGLANYYLFPNWLGGDLTSYIKLTFFGSLYLSIKLIIETKLYYFFASIPKKLVSQHLKWRGERNSSVYPVKVSNKKVLFKWLLNPNSSGIKSITFQTLFGSLEITREARATTFLFTSYLDTSFRVSVTKALSSILFPIEVSESKPFHQDLLDKIGKSDSYSKPVFEDNSLWALETSRKWDIDSAFHASRTDILTTRPQTFFNSDTQNFSDMSLLHILPEYQLLGTDFLETQLNWVRSSKWIYRYSLLHRRNVKASHQNTLTKRLITSGFYDSSLETSNIQVTSLQKLNPFWRTFFSDLTLSSYPLFYGNIQSPLNPNLQTSRWAQLQTRPLLTWSEESLFWIMKRFYLTNTLNSLNHEFTYNLHPYHMSPLFTNSNSNLDTQLLATKLLPPFTSNYPTSVNTLVVGSDTPDIIVNLPDFYSASTKRFGPSPWLGSKYLSFSSNRGITPTLHLIPMDFYSLPKSVTELYLNAHKYCCWNNPSLTTPNGILNGTEPLLLTPKSYPNNPHLKDILNNSTLMFFHPHVQSDLITYEWGQTPLFSYDFTDNAAAVLKTPLTKKDTFFFYSQRQFSSSHSASSEGNQNLTSKTSATDWRIIDSSL